MHDLLRQLMDSAASKAEYADARYVSTRAEGVATRNGELAGLDSSQSEGIGVRVRVGDAWGFAATRETDRRHAEAALRRALAIARAQPSASKAVPLAPEPPAQGSWESPPSAILSRFRWRRSWSGSRRPTPSCGLSSRSALL